MSQAIVVAVGGAADGRRGLTGTSLVISDAHAGLKAGVAAVMVGADWQRCRRVHFLRDPGVSAHEGGGSDEPQWRLGVQQCPGIAREDGLATTVPGPGHA